MDIELEIENAQILLNRINTVEDLTRFWSLFGSTPYSCPSIEMCA